MLKIQIYCKELINYYNDGNATETSQKAIKEVYELELAGVEEHKVTRAFFDKQVKNAGLTIDLGIVVWQPETLRQSNAGSHVLILKHERLA